MASMVKRPVPDRDSSEDELQEMFHKFHITDTTASLLQEEGYTSIKLLENLGTLGPDAVNEISGLRGAQKAAVKAMLKALVPDEGDTNLRPPPYSSFEEVNLSSQPPPCTCFAFNQTATLFVPLVLGGPPFNLQSWGGGAGGRVWNKIKYCRQKVKWIICPGRQFKNSSLPSNWMVPLLRWVFLLASSFLYLKIWFVSTIFSITNSELKKIMYTVLTLVHGTGIVCSPRMRLIKLLKSQQYTGRVYPGTSIQQQCHTKHVAPVT